MVEAIKIGVHPRTASIWLLYSDGEKLRQRLMPVRDLEQVGAETAARALVEKHHKFTEGVSFLQLKRLCVELEQRKAHQPVKVAHDRLASATPPKAASQAPAPLSRDLLLQCAGDLGSSPDSGFDSDPSLGSPSPNPTSQLACLPSAGRRALAATPAPAAVPVRNLSPVCSPQKEDEALLAFAAASPAKHAAVDDALSAFASGSISASSAARVFAPEAPDTRSGWRMDGVASGASLDEVDSGVGPGLSSRTRAVTGAGGASEDTQARAAQLALGPAGVATTGRGSARPSARNSPGWSDSGGGAEGMGPAPPPAAVVPRRPAAQSTEKDVADDILDMMSDFSSDSDSDGPEAEGGMRDGGKAGGARDRGEAGGKGEDEDEDDDPVRAAAARATAEAAAALARAAPPKLSARVDPLVPSVGAPRGFLDGMSSSEDEGEEVCFGRGGVATGSRPSRNGGAQPPPASRAAVQAADLLSEEAEDWDSDGA